MKFECKEEKVIQGITFRKFFIVWEEGGGNIAGKDVTLAPCPNCGNGDFCVSADKRYAIFYCNACRAKFVSRLTYDDIYDIEYRWNQKIEKQIEIINHIDSVKTDIERMEKTIKFLESESLTRIKSLIEKYEAWVKSTSFKS